MKHGNICGTIALGKNPTKTLAIGSHTDSVYNGGQYDGSVGVAVALQAAEELIKSGKVNGILKVAIYACEESSRFGNACVGSKYLNGNIKKEDFNSIVGQSKGDVTLKEAIDYSRALLKKQVPDIKEVEKIFDMVDYSLEVHTEQYDILDREYKKHKKDIIGIVNQIGSSLRIRYNVQGRADHTGSTPMNERSNASTAVSYIGNQIRKLAIKYEKQGLGRADQLELETPEHKRSFNQTPVKANADIDIRLIGDNTPDKALEDFEKIKKKAEKKTRTKIETTVISKGTPVKTNKKLNEKIAEVCKKEDISYMEMPSYPGQDTGYIPAKKKTMIFIPSIGGSHNKNEQTWPKYINPATRIFVAMAQELLKEKFKDKYAVKSEGKTGKGNKKDKNKEKIRLEKDNSMVI